MDHHVALKETWVSGAHAWDASTRRAYANDLSSPETLNLLTSSVNQSKSDKDPSSWLPPEQSTHCEYVRQWVVVKWRWQLTIDEVEKFAIQSVLDQNPTCAAAEFSAPVPAAVAFAPQSTFEPCANYLTQIQGFPTGLTRLGGSDRFETAIQASLRFAPCVPVLYVATSTNYPDALSAASAAASRGGPLLLTLPDTLPSSVRLEIQRLRPAEIVIVGSESAVSERVFTELADLTASAVRIGGADRLETSRLIMEYQAFPTASTAYIATGYSFPDALVATGAAGTLRAPVVLVNGAAETIPESTISSLQERGIQQIRIAGSTPAVTSSIESQLRGRGFSVSRQGGADRYETAALINKQVFASGVSNVMLATGLNFPDALAGAALAGQTGTPLFITLPECVPSSVHNAIASLNPARTIVMGSTVVVSNSAASNSLCPPPAPAPAPNPGPSKPANPGDSKNCSDFRTRAEAQAWFNYYYPHYGDIAKLDGDNDLIACESLR